MSPLLFKVLIFIFSFGGLVVGLFLIANPYLGIEIQRRFYEKINWKIEPISLSREIRNTRLIGWFLLILSIITIALVF